MRPQDLTVRGLTGARDADSTAVGGQDNQGLTVETTIDAVGMGIPALTSVRWRTFWRPGTGLMEVRALARPRRVLGGALDACMGSTRSFCWAGLTPATRWR